MVRRNSNSSLSSDYKTIIKMTIANQTKADAVRNTLNFFSSLML